LADLIFCNQCKKTATCQDEADQSAQYCRPIRLCGEEKQSIVLDGDDFH